MYTSYFQLKEIPFSIAPDPAFLYMSARHQEALGHLLYGTGQFGGFVQLTGEVGTGKTTIIRTLLAQKIENVDVAMIHNPRQSEQEFVQSICDELGVAYPGEQPSLKTLVDALNSFLLGQHEKGRRTVLIIDEAQQLAPEVLEQVRLLTNLETSKEKLLRIMLVGQPELAELLARNDLRQLAQRITARYHLTPLSAGETDEYIGHRLKVAGGSPKLFTAAAVGAIFKHSGGVPRLINVLCDRALLGAYALSASQVSADTVQAAAAEVFGSPRPVSAATSEKPQKAARLARPELTAAGAMRWLELTLAIGALAVAIALGWKYWHKPSTASPTQAASANFVGPMPESATEKLHGGQPAPESLPQGSESQSDEKPAAATVNKLAPLASATATSSATLAAAKTKNLPTALAASPAPAPATAAAASPPKLATAGAATAALNEQMLRLARLWLPGFKASRAEPACRSLHRARLECLRGSGDWSELAAMNSPAILTLSFGKNDLRYALLRGLGKDAVLLGPSGVVQVPIKQLDSLWTGEYLLLWKRETDELSIGPETRGDPILWLRKQLAQRFGIPAGNLENTRWDVELKTAVQHFQGAHGVRPDGVAGARTLLLLAEGSNLPRLRKNG